MWPWWASCFILLLLEFPPLQNEYSHSILQNCCKLWDIYIKYLACCSGCSGVKKSSYFKFWPSLVAQWGRICLPSRRCRFSPWVGKILQRRKWQPSPVFLPGTWEIPWTEEPGGLTPRSHKRVKHDLTTKQQQLLILETDQIYWTHPLTAVNLRLQIWFLNSYFSGQCEYQL